MSHTSDNEEDAVAEILAGPTREQVKQVQRQDSEKLTAAQKEQARKEDFYRIYVTRDQAERDIRSAKSEGRWEVIHITLWLMVIVLPLVAWAGTGLSK